MLLRRIAWLSALVILFSAVVLRVLWSARSLGQGTGVGIGLAFVLVIMAALVSIVIGLLVALIPAKGHRYANRLWLRLPFVLFGVCMFTALAALLPEWYESKHGMEAVSAAAFHRTPSASEADCVSVHDGVFGNEGIRIERHGTDQYQRDKVFGEEEHLTVRWRTPCEYELLDRDPASGRIVKITKVDSLGYDCLVTYLADSTHAYALRLDRIR